MIPRSSAAGLFIAAAKGGGLLDTSNRDKEAIKIHGLLQSNIAYINSIAQGDNATILLSGYDASKHPEPATVPGAPVIKHIDDGVEPGTAKILLAKAIGYKGKRTFIVEMTTTGTNLNSFAIVLIAGSSRKLIIPGLIRGQEVFIRVYSMNSKGKSQYSIVAPFIPRTGKSPGTTPTPTTGTTPPATA